jgi:hypothetical protein
MCKEKVKPLRGRVFQKRQVRGVSRLAISGELVLVRQLMRLFIALITLLLPFVFVVPTQAAEACPCVQEAGSAEIAPLACCELPGNCCWESHSKPDQPANWLLTRSTVDVSAQLVVVATLLADDPPQVDFEVGIGAYLDPPPRSARYLRTVQQSWLI